MRMVVKIAGALLDDPAAVRSLAIPSSFFFILPDLCLFFLGGFIKKKNLKKESKKEASKETWRKEEECNEEKGQGEDRL